MRQNKKKKKRNRALKNPSDNTIKSNTRTKTNKSKQKKKNQNKTKQTKQFIAGQILMDLMVNPPKQGEPSYAQYIKEKGKIENHVLL
jgi:hypothetical protein